MSGVLWPRTARILIPIKSCRYATEDGEVITPVIEVGSVGGCLCIDLPLDEEMAKKLEMKALQLRLDCEESEMFIGACDKKYAEAMGK